MFGTLGKRHFDGFLSCLHGFCEHYFNEVQTLKNYVTQLSLGQNSIRSIMFGPSWLSPRLTSSWTQSAPDFWVKRIHASSTCYC